MRIALHGTPTLEQAHAVCAEIFPDFDVTLMAKASVGGEEFEEWFLRALAQRSQEHFVSAQYAIWETLDELLRAHGLSAPSQLDSWQLNRALFDLRTGSTARMVGFQLPRELAARLAALGFSKLEALDFPALAYRMGLIYTRLAAQEAVEWPELVRLARSVPLTAAESVAVDAARQRAGVWLQPVFDAAGNVWTAERELAPLRALTGNALERRRAVRTVARDLGNSQRAQGVLRDAARVARTEIANDRSHGAWAIDSKGWKADTQLFRQTSRQACSDCLRLYKNADGTPKLYTRAELEAFDAQGPNRGPRETWVPKIGATHPNCCCSPWQAWLVAMTTIFAARAPEYAELMRKLKITKEAA